jgi:succinate dehydrogenase / fumarate reductase cytochrome b subunit
MAIGKRTDVASISDGGPVAGQSEEAALSTSAIQTKDCAAMAATRPLSPHLQIYRWQVQMVTSILHRITGVALCVGTALLVCGLVALAGGADAFGHFTAVIGSVPGMVLMIGWTWALFYHLCNGIRHLVQDMGDGYEIVQFVRSSWLSIIVSVLLTVIVWAWVLTMGAVA